MSTSKSTSKAASKATLTIKSIICYGVKNAHTVDRILKSVKKDHPESKADATHVKYYSGQLKRTGEITEEQHEKYAMKKEKEARRAPVKAVVKKQAVAKAVAKEKSTRTPRAKRSNVNAEK